MYLNRISVNFFFFVAVPSMSLIFAATNNTLSSSKKRLDTVKGTKTGGAVGSAGKAIATRFSDDGSVYTVQQECHCKQPNLCPAKDRVFTSTECPVSSHICCKSTSLLDPVNLNPNPDTLNPMNDANPENCGIRNSLSRYFGARIAAPEDEASAVFGEFPWMVLILKMQFASDGSQTDEGLLCGGSLISSKIVLTAAHCIFKYKNDKHMLKVRVGEFDTRPRVYEKRKIQDQAVDFISIPDNFNTSMLYNDIALIRVTESFNYNRFVNPICVPFLQSPYAISNIYDHTRCIATGWGKRSQSDSNYQHTLKKVELQIFPKDKCQSELQKTNLTEEFELHSSFICAKGLNGGDTCQGDGGGPLVCALRSDSNKYVQVGVVSWGIGCGKTPGVYASLEADPNWLTSEFNILTFN